MKYLRRFGLKRSKRRGCSRPIRVSPADLGFERATHSGLAVCSSVAVLRSSRPVQIVHLAQCTHRGQSVFLSVRRRLAARNGGRFYALRSLGVPSIHMAQHGPTSGAIANTGGFSSGVQYWTRRYPPSATEELQLQATAMIRARWGYP